MWYRKYGGNVPGFRLSVNRRGSWAAAGRRFAQAQTTLKQRQWLAIQRAALMAEAALKRGIVSGAPGGQRFKPLSPFTILLKGSRKPLLDTGSLLGSITTTFDQKRLTAFVGVHRTARSSDGKRLINVALVHEFGTKPFMIRVTPAVRRFFWAMHVLSKGRLQPLSPSKTVIMHPGVPARPFIRPTVAAIRPRLRDVLVKALKDNGGPI